MKQEFIIDSSQSGQRLDVFCVAKMPEFSRSFLQKSIKEGDITVNGDTVKPRYTIQENDAVVVMIEVQEKNETEDAPDLIIPIIHEDEHVVVINKPAGVAVHAGHKTGPATVSSWFIKRYPDAIDVGDDPERPGIVHRLDKDTSGVMVLAKTQDMFEWLKQQFKKHRVRKEYLALVFGVPTGKDGRITRPLARSRRNPLRRTVDPEGKPAVTEWSLEKQFGEDYALLRAFPLTGRTHQIRVHFHFIGNPIVGDALYVFKRKKSPKGARRHLLHAETIHISLQAGSYKTFTAPLPEDFMQIINALDKKYAP